MCYVQSEGIMMNGSSTLGSRSFFVRNDYERFNWFDAHVLNWGDSTSFLKAVVTNARMIMVRRFLCRHFRS